MWFDIAGILVIYEIVAIVSATPAYHHTYGPSYSVNGADHQKPYLEVRNSTYHGSGPREEARAMCSVKTADVNATANATITRRLHGVVTSSSCLFNFNSPGTYMCTTRQNLLLSFATITAPEIASSKITTFGELHSSIQRLEVIIFGQMQQLWQSLDALRAQLSGETQTSFPDRRTMTFRFKPEGN